MKKIVMPLIGVLAIALTETACAQDKYKNDPTYSTRNYKHPNKAAAARAWEKESSIEFTIRNRRPQSLADYREQQRRGGPLDAAIAIPAGPTLANRNYKQQNQVMRPAEREKEVADRQSENSEVGN